MNPDLIITAIACQQAFTDALAADPTLWRTLVPVMADTTLAEWAAYLADWLPACRVEGEV